MNWNVLIIITEIKQMLESKWLHNNNKNTVTDQGKGFTLACTNYIIAFVAEYQHMRILSVKNANRREKRTKSCSIPQQDLYCAEYIKIMNYTVMIK